MQRRTFLATTAATLAGPALAQSAGQTLRYVPQADLVILDPLTTTAYPTRNHGHLCWDTLYGIDADFIPRPQLAEGHIVEDDGKRWTFTLRSGPTFHDGERILAKDAVASIRRWMLRDTHGQTLATRMASIAALDDRRFEIRLNKPFGPMLDALGKASSYPCFILPERFATIDPSRGFNEVVGSGPYRFVAGERVSGSQTVYRRFEAYQPVQGPPPSMIAGPKLAHFERIEWKVMPDPATAAAALQAGEVDWWEQIAADLGPLLRRNRAITVDRIDAGGTMAMLRFNHLHPPFDDPAVRRAILPALAQSDFMQAIMPSRELWKDGVGCFPDGSPLASDAGLAAVTSPRSIDAARRALAATGYAGQPAVMLHATDVVNNNVLGTVGVDLLRRVGFTVDDAVSDWGTVLQRRARREPPAQGGWGCVVVLFGSIDLGNPGAHLLLRANGNDAWFGWPTAPRLEALRDDWFEAPNLPAQQRIGRDIQTQFFQDLPFLPLGQYLIDSAYRRDISGVRRGITLPLNVRRG